MASEQSSAASDRVLVGVDGGRTKFVDRECGKIWYERMGAHSPDYCPSCGRELFEGDHD